MKWADKSPFASGAEGNEEAAAARGPRVTEASPERGGAGGPGLRHVPSAHHTPLARPCALNTCSSCCANEVATKVEKKKSNNRILPPNSQWLVGRSGVIFCSVTFCNFQTPRLPVSVTFYKTHGRLNASLPGRAWAGLRRPRGGQCPPRSPWRPPGAQRSVTAGGKQDARFQKACPRGPIALNSRGLDPNQEAGA